MRLVIPLVLLLTTNVGATEPPCVIPHCMGQVTGITKDRVALVSADGKLEVRLVATDNGMVLVEIVREADLKKVVEPVVAAFAIKSGNGIELVPFAGDLKKPLLVFAGPWLTSPSKLGGVAIAQARTSVDGKALFGRYKKQQQAADAKQQQSYAAGKLAESMKELNAKCGTSITAAMDWSKLPDRWFETSMRDAAYVCEDNFFGFAINRCETAAGKQAIAAKLKHVVCVYKPSGALGMKLDNGTLTIELSLSANRERQGSQAHRYLEPKL